MATVNHPYIGYSTQPSMSDSTYVKISLCLNLFNVARCCLDLLSREAGQTGGVGHDHVLHKALRKIILLNTVIQFVESTESHNSYFIVITYNHCYC